MQVVRTIVWIVVTAILVAFIAMNWNEAPVNFWPIEGENRYLHFEWPVGVIAFLFFLLGLLPMWALHRARVWQLNRRIAGLENSVRAAATVTPVPAETVKPAEASPAAPLPQASVAGSEDTASTEHKSEGPYAP